MRRPTAAIVVGLITSGLLLASLVGIEIALQVRDAHQPRNDRDFTWGYRVIKNQLGFREREVALPKPAGLYRVMVLGDSLTWGVGLPDVERYTALLEMRLKAFYGVRHVEVLNFALEGTPTTIERDILVRFAPSVEPDLVMVGFCFNDPQPRSQDYAVERERHSHLYTAIHNLRHVGLSKTALRLRASVDRLLAIPPWPEALDRTYAQDSSEWTDFVAALADIVAVTRARQLPAPLFVPLLTFDGDYGRPDALLQRVLRWAHQAAAAAQAVGFLPVSLDEAFIAEGSRVRAVNAWDQHPDAQTHSIYAKRLAAVIAPLVHAQARQAQAH